MTQEERNLLLIDLSARVCYGVMCDRLGHPLKLVGVHPNKEFALEFDRGEYMPTEYTLEDVKPYLHPMSSMTEEERKEVNEFLGYRKTINGFGDIRCAGWNGDTFVDIDKIVGYMNWLNEHHFDYRGLIEKGLAIEAPEGMY